MSEELRNHIGEIYDGGAWEKVTGTFWKNGDPWDIWKFEHDVEFGGRKWRCIILQRVVYDPDDVDAVAYADDILAEAWEL